MTKYLMTLAAVLALGLAACQKQEEAPPASEEPAAQAPAEPQAAPAEEEEMATETGTGESAEPAQEAVTEEEESEGEEQAPPPAEGDGARG